VTSEDARRVLKMLTSEGVLESRGARRGTHYVVVEKPVDEENDAPVPPVVLGTSSGGDVIPTTARTAVDDALRRVLRRRW
jgi:hypothetical protein